MLLAAILLSATPIGGAVASDGRTEYEAEDQKTSGVLIGPSFAYGEMAAEASGRRAVLIERKEQSIEFNLRAPARGLTVRYFLPELSSGLRESSSLDVLAGGRRIATAVLTSNYTTAAPMPPEAHLAGRVHHDWEEVRLLLPTELATGTKVTLRMSPSARPRPFAVDLVDAETVPHPDAMPRRAISVEAFGADPTGQRSARTAFERAIALARRDHKELYVPPGHFHTDGHLIVDGVTIIGAGSWYSILSGHGLGLYSRQDGSNRVTLSSFAIESDVADRIDALPEAAIGGTFSNSRFEALYLHHSKVGIWLDGPSSHLLISNVEIADQAADGINLHRGISDARIEYNRIRNTGDDGIASWSDGLANKHIIIRGNRVTAPGLANGIALYGGSDLEVSDNRVSDTLIEGGGIHLGTRFHSTPFGGKILITNNLVVRSGSMDPNWKFGIGAIWLYALERPINADIMIRGNHIAEAPCEALQLVGQQRIDGVRIQNLSVDGLGGVLLAIQAPGSATINGVSTAIDHGPGLVEVPRNFRLISLAQKHRWIMQSMATVHPPKCN